MKNNLADKIGSGIQLFRIKTPEKYFEKIADLGALKENMIESRQVWRLNGTENYYALLTIPYKDLETILVRAENDQWKTWSWEALAEKADGCRWKGPGQDRPQGKQR